MKVLLFMAMSANGFIARKNGEEDFLSEYNWKIFRQLAKKYNSVVWGRKTYQTVQGWGKKYSLKDLINTKKIVITQSKSFKPKDGFEAAASPKEAIQKLKKEKINTLLLSGGSALNSAFAKQNLIDEIVFNLEPTIIGNGIPVFQPESLELDLKLVSAKRFNQGGIALHYTVQKRRN